MSWLPQNTIVLRITFLNPPIELIFTRTYFYLWSYVAISFFLRIFWISFFLRIFLHLFFLWESFFKSLLIFLKLFFLWEFFWIAFLWESFWISFVSENLFESLSLSIYLSLSVSLCLWSCVWIYFLNLYENKQVYEFHHTKQIFGHRKQIMIFCLFRMFQVYGFCFEFFSFFVEQSVFKFSKISRKTYSFYRIRFFTVNIFYELHLRL